MRYVWHVRGTARGIAESTFRMGLSMSVWEMCGMCGMCSGDKKAHKLFVFFVFLDREKNIERGAVRPNRLPKELAALHPAQRKGTLAAKRITPMRHQV